MFKLIFSLVLVTLLSTPAMGQIYKWIDRDGVVHFTDTPTEGKYISPDQNNSTANQNNSTDSQSAALNSLYDDLMNEASNKKKTVGGSACFLCAAELVQIVYASRIPVRREFFDIMDGVLNNRKLTVGGLLNEVTRAGLVQGISLPSSGPCLTATFHSK